MRSKRLAKNTISSLTLQITTIICGFILPRLILSSFGSNVNGLVNSITQFLTFITFIEFGVGSVVQSAFYKPLAEHDNETVSKIFKSSKKYFTMLGNIVLAYVIVLIFVYPIIANDDLGYIFTATLVAAMSVGTIMQYYFSITERIIIGSDQKGYLDFTSHTIMIILNTICCAILIKLGASIHVVKFTTSMIFLGRPIFFRWYVNKHYDIDKNITYDEEPIKQKWNGIAQHISYVVLIGTDQIVLTTFSNLANVSIYSVYYLVLYGLKSLYDSLFSGIQPLLGELYAKGEHDNVKNIFGWSEWLMHTLGAFCFTCAACLIVPFVSVYTSGINDANYIQPTFAILITVAYFVFSINAIYQTMMKVCGHFKETQNCFIISAASNVIISILCVIKFGLVGVAIGTLVSMTYQLIALSKYVYLDILKIEFSGLIKQVLVDVISFIIGLFLSNLVDFEVSNYLTWVLLAIPKALIILSVILVINIIIYPGRIKTGIEKVIGKFIKK